MLATVCFHMRRVCHVHPSTVALLEINASWISARHLAQVTSSSHSISIMNLARTGSDTTLHFVIRLPMDSNHDLRELWLFSFKEDEKFPKEQTRALPLS